MKNVYFETKIQNNENSQENTDIKYYLDLILDETASCLSSNAIKYSERESSAEDAVGIGLIMDISNVDAMPEIKIVFSNGSASSGRLANIMYENFKKIYYDPSMIKISLENNGNSDSKKTYVNVYFENPQNPEFLSWIRQNIQTISKEIIMSLTEFFGTPYVACDRIYSAIALKDESIRERPNLISDVVESIKEKEKIDVLGQWEDWYIVEKNGNLGFVQTKFIEI